MVLIKPPLFTEKVMHIFGRSFTMKPTDTIRKQLTTADFRLSDYYKPGDMFEIEDDYYILNDARNLEFLAPATSQCVNIGPSVTKNIRDFRKAFKEHLCGHENNHHQIAIGTIDIRHDDVFLLEEFGRAFDPAIQVQFIHYEDVWLELRKHRGNMETIVLLHCRLNQDLNPNPNIDIHIDPGIDIESPHDLYRKINDMLDDFDCENTDCKNPKLQHYRHHIESS